MADMRGAPVIRGEVPFATTADIEAYRSTGLSSGLDPVVTAIGSDPKPIGVLSDGYLYGILTDALYRSSDSGATWTLLTTVSTIGSVVRRIWDLDDGEVLLQRGTTLVKSSGWATNPATATWSVALNIGDRTVAFDAWSVDVRDGKVLAADYGQKQNQPWRLWYSSNNGDTFSKVLDLADHRTAPELAETHWHGVAIDAYRDRLYAVNGDGPDTETCAFWWSDDAGSTWHEVAATLGNERITTLMVLEHGILCGSDSGVDGAPNGVWRVNPDDLEDWMVLYEIHTGIAGLTHVATSAQIGSDGYGYMAFSPYGSQSAPSVIVGSVDGRSVHELWRDPSPTASDTDRQLLQAVGPDMNGKIIGYLSSTGTGYRLVVDAPVLGRGSDQDPGHVGRGTAVNQTAVAVGAAAHAGDDYSVAVGQFALAGTGASSTGNTAVGYDATAGTGSLVQSAVAVGYTSDASGFGAVALGAAAAAGQASVAVGWSTDATGVSSVAIGHDVTTATLSVGIGQGATAAYTRDVAVGRNASCSSVDATAVGQGAEAGWQATAIGSTASATHQAAVALGYGAATTAASQVATGAKHVELVEIADPSSGATNSARLYVRDNGAGKTQLVVRFSTGAIQILATEP